MSKYKVGSTPELELSQVASSRQIKKTKNIYKTNKAFSLPFSFTKT
jgi:hypothetical protein